MKVKVQKRSSRLTLIEFLIIVHLTQFVPDPQLLPPTLHSYTPTPLRHTINEIKEIKIKELALSRPLITIILPMDKLS
jgi:hypothetical protein